MGILGGTASEEDGAGGAGAMIDLAVKRVEKVDMEVQKGVTLEWAYVNKGCDLMVSVVNKEGDAAVVAPAKSTSKDGTVTGRYAAEADTVLTLVFDNSASWVSTGSVAYRFGFEEGEGKA